ncbi:Uncharacterized protein TCM_033776 [Theobroma cacao]|uniref:Uncharacterized protein n=1 Tax=Theobroma cacao TaxID=3641 RepID=A0A061FIQ8_THECC|nr:Uncharacterized protein TCM_033776 [Theobroma cacao]
MQGGPTDEPIPYPESSTKLIMGMEEIQRRRYFYHDRQFTAHKEAHDTGTYGPIINKLEKSEKKKKTGAQLGCCRL